VLFEALNRAQLSDVFMASGGRLGRSRETGRRRDGNLDGSVFCLFKDAPLVAKPESAPAEGLTNLLRGSTGISFCQEILRCCR
jgi:hypothetical protein